MWTQPFINSIVLVFLTAAVMFVATLFWTKRGEATKKAEGLAAENKKLTDRVLDMEKQLGMLNQAVLPISTAFQAILIKELTHFHTPEMDALMVKIGPPNTLSDEEAARLVVMLEERTKDMAKEISDTERDAALMLPLVMKRAKMDIESEKKLQLVSVPPVLKGGEQAKSDDAGQTSGAADAVADKKAEEQNG